MDEQAAAADDPAEEQAPDEDQEAAPDDEAADEANDSEEPSVSDTEEEPDAVESPSDTDENENESGSLTTAPVKDTDSEEPARSDVKTADDADVSRASDEGEAETPAMPAQTFEDTYGGMTFSVAAPEGALPESASMEIVGVEQSEVEDNVSELISEGIKQVKAFKFVFKNADGETITPEKPVTVTLSGKILNEADDFVVIRIKNNNENEVHLNMTETTAEFTSDGTDTYAAVSFATSYQVAFYKDADDTTPFLTKDYSIEGTNTLGALPEGPAKIGSRFDGWMIYDGDTPTGDYASMETPVTGNMKLVADYTELTKVVFIMNDGTDDQVISQFDREEGTVVGSLPEEPFKEGYVFDKWVIEDTEEEVTENTVVPEGGLRVIATFKRLHVYTINVQYYYTVNGQRVDFEEETYKIKDGDAPYTITPPASTRVDEQYDATEPTYYPSQPQVQITAEELDAAMQADTYTIDKEVEYVERTADYDFVYLLKDLEGDGYTEFDRVETGGVVGSTVTPLIKEYPYAEFESTESVLIVSTGRDGQPKQSLPVYYTRKPFTLSYNVDGGSYVAPVTAPYGTQVAISGNAPTKTGYDFGGWYEDAGLTKRAGSSVTLDADKTLYAKWNPKTVNYTIVYMMEKYDNNTNTTYWEYDRSRTASAQVGTTVYGSSAPALTNNINGYEADTAYNAASSVVIEADGSSVLTVHYKLIRYTLTFNHRVNYNNHNYNSATVTVGGRTYTNSNYSISNVVLGQDISALWPSDVNSGRNNYSFTGWRYTNTSGGTTARVTKVIDLTWELVARANSNRTVTFNARYDSNVSEKGVEYWLQQADGTYAKSEAY
ncbi:MAG: InlB B-repeat-containing protein, partial [Lachnospiraceae bacterium]|nr:InlB B-repeat-containing protein [Lachnospiraceae bacterium]